MNSCVFKTGLRLACGGLSLGLLILMTGCGKKNPHSVEHAEVSGKVILQGKPLPGGRITFSAVNGSFAASEAIEENGNYKVQAPVGEVKIAVDNRMLAPKGKSAPPKNMSHPLPPDRRGGKEEKGVKGRFVPIPTQYTDASTSGLTYTVKPGSQTHDIELSDKPSSPPGAPGP